MPLTDEQRAKQSAAMTKTHCIHGHSLDNAYIVYHKGYADKRVRMRICKPCQLARNIKYRAKKALL